MTTGPAPICGNGVVEDGEECDDGDGDDSDSCTSVCTLAVCGDGWTQNAETCDDGNLDNEDSCTNACVKAACGDGLVQDGEACDYGDLDPGDTCDRTCASTKIASLAVGGEFVCIAFEDGAVRCWGQGEYGALGQGKTDDLGNDPDELPVANVEVGGKVTQLAAGHNHVCALLDSDKVRCWGSDAVGQLGDGPALENRGDIKGQMPPPDVALGPDIEVQQIAAGQGHTCAIVTGGKVRCWGGGAYGALGYGSVANRPAPALVNPDVPGVEGATQIALGGEHSCAVIQTGEVLCWGGNSYGELGLGHVNSIGDQGGEVPMPAVIGGIATQVTAGARHTCALMEGGTVRCWGAGKDGRLGTGNEMNVGDKPGPLPTDVDLGMAKAHAVIAGAGHTCALLERGDVRCWGFNSRGMLGSGNTTSLLKPGAPVQLGSAVRLLSASGTYAADIETGVSTCVVLFDDTLRCWGGNRSGQLGLGNELRVGDDEKPVSVGTVPF
jgi:cysteine-rich repeat protein